MRKADFKARIKKIEIVNRVLTDGWAQSIRVILEDIDLSDENLLELKQFRPNEQVLVELSPVQLNIFDIDKKQRTGGTGGQSKNSQELIGSDNEEEEFISFLEEDQPLKDNEKVEKEWKFDAG
jgi:hypothetical protein